jgi:hypothetical protein
MIRLMLGFMLSSLIVSSVLAQGMVWNPNSPRGRRDIQLYPPPAVSSPVVGSTIVPERFGSLSTTWPAQQWGTLGAYGWAGTSLPTWQPQH